MSSLNKLKFNKMEVDVKLALEYFKQNNLQFGPIYNEEHFVKDSNSVHDQSGNRIYLTKEYQRPSIPKQRNLTKISASLWQLAKKIEENENLFCQLEYLIYNSPIENCQKHLQILINKCLYWSTVFDKTTDGNNIDEDDDIEDIFHSKVNVASKSILPLALLIEMIYYKKFVVLDATPQTAAICTLFFKLCKQVGLQELVQLNIYLEEKEETVWSMKTRQKDSVGIVTETADIDSAVHAFVASTSESPWCLKQILVHESVYKDFQAALEWKCRPKPDEVPKQYDQNLKNLCTDIQIADKKIFLIDYVGGGDTSKLTPIEVEAYRTTKDLLAIVSKNQLKFVSLWASNIAEANEIAHSIKSPLIWLNSYGVFNGPPQIAADIFSYQMNPSDMFESMQNKAEKWLKLDEKKRRDTMLAALQTVFEKDDVKKSATKLQTLLRTQRLGFVEINKQDMWVGVEQPVGFVYVGTNNETGFFIDAIASIVHGNRVVLSSKFSIYSPLIAALEDAGVPVRIADKKYKVPTNYKLYHVKMIYTTFGTIFAN